MINHIRTLLLNQASLTVQDPSFPGEEYVPAGFSPVTLTPELTRVRDILFDPNPDRAMLNYRLRQYMPMLHSVPFLDSYVRSLDSRITYDTSTDTTLVNPTAYAVNVSQTPEGAQRTLIINGDVYSIVARSKLRKVWTVEVIDGSTVEVSRITPPADRVTSNYTTSDGLTSPIELVGSSLTVYVEPVVGTKWVVETFARPATSLVDIWNRLQQLDNTTLTAIFGRNDEPFTSFQRMWVDSRGLGIATRLGSFVLAYGYRLEERRQNRE